MPTRGEQVLVQGIILQHVQQYYSVCVAAYTVSYVKWPYCTSYAADVLRYFFGEAKYAHAIVAELLSVPEGQCNVHRLFTHTHTLH